MLRFNPSPLDVHLVAGDLVMEKVIQLCMMGCGTQVDIDNSTPIEPGFFIAGSRICKSCVAKRILKRQAELITLY